MYLSGPESSAFSFTRKVGESEWLAEIIKPVKSPRGTRKARREEPLRVT